MQTRKQSCGACQKLRIGCNVKSRRGDPCSNCVRRGRACIVKASHSRTDPLSIPTCASTTSDNNSSSNGSRSLLAPPRDHEFPLQESIENISSLRASPRAADFNADDNLVRHRQALTLHDMLWNIFAGIMEPELVVWTGFECCPFKQSFNDAECPKLSSTLGLDFNSTDPNNDIVKQALLSAVYAFSASRLPVPWEAKVNLMQQLWSEAHQRVYPAMTRPTYCSILALHLFGITPTRLSSFERGAGDLSLEVSLRHYKQISLRSRVFSYYSPTMLDQPNHAPQDEEALNLSQMQDTAYWLGVIWDTSRTLTRCQPSILVHAHLDSDKLWNRIREELPSFEQSSQMWRDSRLPLSIENIYSTIQHGSAYVVLVWKAISMVQAALFHNLEVTTVEQAAEIAVGEINRFDEVFGPLLGLCRRDFILLNEKIRISSFILNLHHSLGVLILVDTLAATYHSHLISCEYELRISSARSIVNFVSIILQTDHCSTGSHLEKSNLLQVPYSEHLVNGLSRAGHSLLLLYRNKSVSASMVETMFSIIFTALKILQQVSYSAAEEYTNFLAHCDDGSDSSQILKASSGPHMPVQQELEPNPARRLDLFRPEIITELEHIITSDSALLERTVTRCEHGTRHGPSLPTTGVELRAQSYI